MSEYLEPLLATPCIWSFAASPVGGRAPIIFLGWPSVFVRPLVRCEIKHQPKQINKPTTMLQNSIRFFVRSTSGVPVTNGSEKTRPTLFLKPSHCRRIRQIIRSRKQQENGREAILIHCNYCITFILDLIPLTCRTQKRRSSYNQSTCSFKSFGFWLKKKEVLLSPFNQPKKTYNIINCSQTKPRDPHNTSSEPLRTYGTWIRSSSWPSWDGATSPAPCLPYRIQDGLIVHRIFLWKSTEQPAISMKYPPVCNPTVASFGCFLKSLYDFPAFFKYMETWMQLYTSCQNPGFKLQSWLHGHHFESFVVVPLAMCISCQFILRGFPPSYSIIDEHLQYFSLGMTYLPWTSGSKVLYFFPFIHLLPSFSSGPRRVLRFRQLGGKGE